MKLKKFVAYITAMVMLVLSCGIVAASEVRPTAEIGTTVCVGAELVGSYTYSGAQPQGSSIFRWYQSDSIFDKGTVIEGANEQTFVARKATEGKFLTFAVVPVDENGISGDEVCADPVMQNPGYYEDFSAGLPGGLEADETAEGTGSVAVADDPSGGSEKALKVYKNPTSSFQTEARLGFSTVSAQTSFVEVSLYASDIVGQARLFGVYSDTYGSVLELRADESGKLYYRGKSGLTQSLQAFPMNQWNRIVIRIDGEAKTVEAQINGESIINGSGTEGWRFNNDGYNNVALRFLNYGNGGSIYIKNLAVVNADSTSAAADADANALVDEIPEDTEQNITLPSTGKNGSYIYWKSSAPEYITDEGVVTRPDMGEGDKDVVLTAYVVNGTAIVKKQFTVAVWEGTEKPVAENVQLAQNESRPIIASYKYYDSNGDKEEGTVIKWYVEENGEYRVIDGVDGLIFVPSAEYNGRTLKFSVTPRSEANVTGVETFSGPLTYVYYETQKPVAQITEKKVNSDGAFEIKYSYVSPDYITEGATLIKWYTSEALFGEYSAISTAQELTYAPERTDVYYKVSVTPVDAEGNEGDEVISEPFMYAPADTDSATVAAAAISALVIPESTNCKLELPSATVDGAYYTYISSDSGFLSADGSITRPSKAEESREVTLTAYAVCGFEIKAADFTVVVDKLTEPPVLADVRLGQVSRPINIEYTYSDPDENDEGNTIYQWYYKAAAQSELILIEGANKKSYAPASSMDGYIFVAKVTPVDDTNTAGEAYVTPEYTYVYQAPAIPAAVTGEIKCSLLCITGVYTYHNSDGIEEGDSLYQWYVSSSLLGEYEPIAGAGDKTIEYSSEYDGKYIKFSVVPKDLEGVTGDMVMSSPVLISYGEAQEFNDESIIANELDISELSGGTAEITGAPGDASNKVLALTRTSTKSGEMSKIKIPVPEHTGAAGIIIEADVYPTSATGGTWEMFYINSDAGSNAYKLYCPASTTPYLSTRGGATYINGEWKEDSSSVVSRAFTKDVWHTIRVVMDYGSKTVLETRLDGNVVQENMPFRSNIESVGMIHSYLQNGTTGTVYMDNVRFTPVYDLTGTAEEDAMAISLNADLNSVVSNLRLPAEGSVNGSKIVWASSDESVITARGRVSRPSSEEGDKNVTLTAYVINGSSYYEREFDVTVTRILTDAEITEYDSRELDKYSGMMLNGNITLPRTGSYGSDFTWVSSDESAVTNDGAVTLTSEKKDVSFEITIESGAARLTKTVVMTVVPLYGTNLIINGGLSASSVAGSSSAVYAGDNDYSTHWSSLARDASPYILMDMGKSRDVNRLYLADKTKTISSVTLSASSDKTTWTDVPVTKNASGDNISFVEFSTVNVRYVRAHINSTGEAAAITEAGLFYVEADSDIVSGGLESLTLPVSGTITSGFSVTTALSDGTPVQWFSSDAAISFSGSTALVTRAAADKYVTITATVVKGSVSEQKMFVLVVKGTGASGGSSGGSGGSFGGGLSAAGTIPPGVSVAEDGNSVAGFTDIGVVPWATEAINKLASAGIINGVSQTSFEPLRSITREEFAAVLYRVFAFDKAEETKAFSDVTPDKWYYEPVMQLSGLGIVNGVGEEIFGTGATITRQDMASMIYRAATLAGAQLNTADELFADDSLIDAYAKEAIYALSGSEIVNGVGDGIFNPKGNATRAEAAVIIFRIMNYMNLKGAM